MNYEFMSFMNSKLRIKVNNLYADIEIHRWVNERELRRMNLIPVVKKIVFTCLFKASFQFE